MRLRDTNLYYPLFLIALICLGEVGFVHLIPSFSASQCDYIYSIYKASPFFFFELIETKTKSFGIFEFW